LAELLAKVNQAAWVFSNSADILWGNPSFCGPTQSTVRYSPAKITGCEKHPQLGDPDIDRVCTSHVERLNLTIRMNLRRFARLTNGHSKSLKHHVAMQAILFAWYNFCRKHMTIKATPAMASGLADKVWSLRELFERAAEAA
jgi:hypothetical protein